jgi:hypothetical protein
MNHEAKHVKFGMERNIRANLAWNTKMTVFWDVAPCSDDDRPDDGGSKHVWNVGKLIPDYTTQQARRQSF